MKDLLELKYILDYIDGEYINISILIHLNQSNKNPHRRTKIHKKLVDNLDYKDVKFPVSKKVLKIIE